MFVSDEIEVCIVSAYDIVFVYAVKLCFWKVLIFFKYFWCFKIVLIYQY
jgi:hypothetical protein